jgi:hypothetical protein
MTAFTRHEYVRLSNTAWLGPTSSTAVTLYITKGDRPDDSTGQANVLYSQSLTLATIKSALQTVLRLDGPALHSYGG